MKIHRFHHSKSSGWANLPESNFDSESTLVIAFCSPLYREDEGALKELSDKFSNSIVVGCSTSGEIHQNEIHDLSISAAAIQLESSKLRYFEIDVSDPSQSYDAGRKLAEELNGEDLKGVIVLSDGLFVNGSHLSQGLNQYLPQGVSVTGGLAGDGNHFKHTWVLSGGKPKSKIVSAVGIYGPNIEIRNSSQGGWDIFGPERLITKSKGNILYEIDGKPALELYKSYLGEKANELPASALLFPLQIRKDSEDLNHVVRTILAVNEDEQSMTFAGDVPTGFQAQLMRANFERVIDAAYLAGEETAQTDPDSITLAISCVGRRLALGQRALEETESLLNSVGRDGNVIGFYSYGELGPHANGDPCDFHNQTMTVVNIFEKKVA